MKEEIHIRSKALRNGNRSLYLDIYAKGVRRYEFLRLYLVPETDAGAKAKNEQTMKVAESVKAQRVLSLYSGRYNLPVEQTKIMLFPVLEAQASKRGVSWVAMVKHLHAYEKHKRITIDRVTREWVIGFRSYLEALPAKQNTRWLYWSKLVAAVHFLYDEGLLQHDVLRGVKPITREPTERVYLTIDELRLLSATPCADDATRRMFLFSCLTGLRYSDCIALKWSQVEDTPTCCRLVFRQKKTGAIEYLSINEQAREYMGARQEDNVFPFVITTTLNDRLQRWAKDAGLRKHISFHCARHTFATMMLSLGTDLFVVSRLLGHKSISTTQIYAHILDEEKRAAVDRIPRL